MGQGIFYAYHLCGELDETALADFGVNSIGSVLPSHWLLSLPLPLCFYGRVVFPL